MRRTGELARRERIFPAALGSRGAVFDVAIIRCAKGVTTGYEDGLDRAYERAGQRIARQLTGRRPQRAEMSAQGSPARNAQRG